MDKLLEILKELRPDVDFVGNTQLVDSGELDSFDIVMLVGELNDAFELTIPIGSIVPENFNSTEAMMALIKEIQAQ